MSIQYALCRNGDDANVTVFVPGQAPQVAVDSHPNFKAIVASLLNQDDAPITPEALTGLFDVTVAASQKFDALSERVTVANGTVYFDGDEVDSSLASAIARFVEADVADWMPLVDFMEKVNTNPEPHSREQLYDWLNAHNFTLTPEGDIVGYKGVTKRYDGSLVSGFIGQAIVDGEQHDGHIPNEVGSVVEMPRSEVVHDPATACSTGLHVGTFSYAQSWAKGAMLEVHVNPRDVVSVPTDAHGEKVRVCRYTVVDVIDQPYAGPVTTWVEDSSEEDFDAEYDEDEGSW